MTMTITLESAMYWTEYLHKFTARGYPDITQAALIATHEALLEALERERELIKRELDFTDINTHTLPPDIQRVVDQAKIIDLYRRGRIPVNRRGMYNDLATSINALKEVVDESVHRT